VGDRILEMGGRPATNDVAPLWTIEQQVPGTKVPVVISRPDVKDRVRIVVELRASSPPQ
jgi:hypothetical protein